MADEPKLVVALEARLDRFEKQLKQAGLLAEQQMKQIEDRTSSIAVGTALGNIIAKGIEKAIKSAIDEIQKAIDLMKELGSVAAKTAISFEDIQRIGFAAAQSGMSQDDTLKGLNAIGANMEQMNRRETELSQLLEANNVKYKDRNGLVVDANKGLELAAGLMAKAGNAFEKIEIARIFGLSEQWVGVLGQGVEAFRKMKAQANIDADLQKNVEATKALFKIVYSITAEFQNWGHAISSYVLEPLASALQMVADFTRYVAEVNKGGVIGEVTEKNAQRWEAIAKSSKEAAEAAKRPNIPVFGKTGVTWPQTGDGEKDPLTTEAEKLRKNAALMQAEFDMVGKNLAEQEKARELALLQEAALRAGAKDKAAAEAMITNAMREQVDQAAVLKQRLAERQAQWTEMLSASKEFGSLMSDAMKGLVLEGKKFDEVLRNITNRIASKAFDKLFDLMFAAPSGGGGSLFMQLLGINAPGRMAGGPVSSGNAFMVGERGPELFVPNRNGMIVPNSTLRGGGSGDVNVGSPVTNIRVDGSADRETITLMQQMLAARDRRFVADVASASREIRRRSVRV